MIDRRSGRPLYRQVADDLRRRIRSGDLQPGQELRAEADLAHDFGVGVDTIRDAIAELATEGVILRRGGARHRVAGPPERTVVDVDAPGDVEIEAGPASDAERAELGLPLGAWVLRIYDLTMMVDGEPALWQVVPTGPGRRVRVDRGDGAS